MMLARRGIPLPERPLSSVDRRRMKTAAGSGLLLLTCLASGGCVATTARESPIGQACHRSFSYDASPRLYHCLFELSSPSTFYDDKNVLRVLESFMSSEGGTCIKQPERLLADVKTAAMDHGLKYRLVMIECR